MSTVSRGAGSLRVARNWPTKVKSATLASAYAAELALSEPASAAAATSAPSVGPMNWLVIRSTAVSWPLAFESCALSATIAGRIDCAAVSNNVSPTPSTKATRYSVQSCSALAATTAANAASNNARPRLTNVIVRRRSSRSAKAPAWSANSSHGSRPTNVTDANAPGSRVMPSVTSGSVICSMPSARLEAADDAIRRLRLLLALTRWESGRGSDQADPSRVGRIAVLVLDPHLGVDLRYIEIGDLRPGGRPGRRLIELGHAHLHPALLDRVVAVDHPAAVLAGVAAGLALRVAGLGALPHRIVGVAVLERDPHRVAHAGLARVVGDRRRRPHGCVGPDLGNEHVQPALIEGILVVDHRTEVGPPVSRHHAGHCSTRCRTRCLAPSVVRLERVRAWVPDTGQFAQARCQET